MTSEVLSAFVETLYVSSLAGIAEIIFSERRRGDHRVGSALHCIVFIYIPGCGLLGVVL